MSRTITRRRTLTAVALTVVLALGAGCAGGTTPAASGSQHVGACAIPKPASRTGSNQATGDQVTYLTGFGTTPRESYGWVADGKGFFANAGIKVKISAGQPSDGNLKTLAAKQADFAAVDFVSAVRGVASYPNTYCAVAAVQTSTLLSMITLEGRGITGPKDLVGKKLGTAPAAATQTLFPRYATLAGFNYDPKKPGKTQLLNFPSDQLPGLLASGAIDAMGAYAIDVPSIRNAAHGVKPIVIPYSDYIMDLYGTVILARIDLIRNNPGLVQRFVTAMLDGINYAVNNPDDAGQIVHKAVPTDDAAIVSETMKLMKPNVGSAAFDDTKVERGIVFLESANLDPAVPSGTQPSDVVDTAFVKVP